MQHDNLESEHKFQLNTDLLLSQNLPRTIFDADAPKQPRAAKGWQPHFLAKDFIGLHLGINTENFRLDEETLLEYGKKVTELRKSIRKRAEEVATQEKTNSKDSAKQLQEAIRKIRNRRATKT